ncbi:MAG: tetratricopeptide repeat protein, partial [Phycisphaerae bacterium]
MNGAGIVEACATGGLVRSRGRPWRGLWVAALGLMAATALHASVAVAVAASPAKTAPRFKIKHLPDPYHAKRLFMRALKVGAPGATAALHSLIFAAETQNPVAEYWLGKYYLAEAKRNKRYEPWGLRWLRDSAREGCRRAAGKLYDIYAKVDNNHRLSHKYLAKAAALGWPPAQYRLGLELITGHPATADIARGLNLLHSAATARYLPALRELYQISISPNISPIYRHEARHAIAAAGSMGWTAADNAVALAFLHAPHPDYQAALRWARIGEGRGNASSDCVLGRLYEAGEGVRKNPKRAFMY